MSTHDKIPLADRKMGIEILMSWYLQSIGHAVTRRGDAHVYAVDIGCQNSIF